LALSRIPKEIREGVPIFRYGYAYPFLGLTASQRKSMDKKGGNLISLPLFAALLQANDVRLFHAHALKRLGGEVLTAARLKRKPFIVTLHGGVFEVPAEELHQMEAARARTFEWGKAVGMLFRARRVLEDADAVICLGQDEYDTARRTLVHNRIHLIGNGVDPGRFSCGNGDGFRRQLGIPPDAQVLACYSRFDPQKDQGTLLEAFLLLAKRYPRLFLVLAGPETVSDYVATLDATIAASSFSKRIRRLPAISFSGPALADAYAGCDIFALCSRHEPFGIVVLEAWASGKPVVATRVGGLQKLITDGVDGFHFEVRDAAGCADRVGRLLADPPRARAMGEQGRRTALAHHTWASVAERTEMVYQEAERRFAAPPA
jgi:glycosyltransferase involved in cell wall biosynthesis